MTSISVSSFSFYKHLPASLIKRRQRVSSKKLPEPHPAPSTLYYSPFDATARSSVRGCSSSQYALPTASYGYSSSTLAKGEDWRRTKRRKSLKRSSVKLRAARGWKEASGLKKQWKGTKTTTHLCKNIRRWDIEKISTWVGGFLSQHTDSFKKATRLT